MIVTELKSLNRINEYNVDILILNTKFTSVCDFYIELNQLHLFNNKNIALNIDKIIEEDELIELDDFIKQALNYDITYYIYTDMSVYCILKKYNLESKSVFFSKTINCSTYDIKEYNKLNIKCLVSTELTIDDLIKISNIESNFIYTYGFFSIFYSKRKLLSLYKEYANLNYQSQNKKYTLLEETREEHYPVIENKNGTFVYGSYNYLLFKEIDLLNKNNYFYISSLFIDEDDLIKIINIYNNGFKNGFNEELLEQLNNINPNTGSSFLYLKPEILKESK